MGRHRARRDWEMKRVSSPESAGKDRDLRTSRPSSASLGFWVFTGISASFESRDRTTENRGVPGSSPGLAIVECLETADYLISEPGPRRSDWVPGSRVVPGLKGPAFVNRTAESPFRSPSLAADVAEPPCNTSAAGEGAVRPAASRAGWAGLPPAASRISGESKSTVVIQHYGVVQGSTS